MNNYGKYITPEEAVADGDTRPLWEIQRCLKQRGKTCMCCDEEVWMYGGCGMCFSCTTGESDASDDVELM